MVLYASPTGRAFDTSDSDSNDLKWLLKAINSLRWYPRSEYDQDIDSTIISSLMRQAYVRFSVAEHPAPAMARAFAMFHDRIAEATEYTDDLDAALRQSIGLSRSDLWTFCFAIYMFYSIECVKDGGAWVITPSFFTNSPKRTDLKLTLQRALAAIAKTPDELRSTYRTNRKYHNPELPEEYWPSEFNILRDFPILDLGNDKYCCPFPVFAWIRGGIGYYFDLVTHYADIERKTNPKNRNPFDNKMGAILGDVFQDYVGLQLKSLAAAKQYVQPEFKYRVGKDTLDTPDWLLDRIPHLPVLFECKARRPTLGMQTRCTRSDRESEVKGEISRALAQLCIFLRNAQASHTSPFTFGPDDKCVYALVLYDSFPYHALPTIRNIIDSLAQTKNSDWMRYKGQVYFVPLSIQEMELACLIEQRKGQLIEHQFVEYADYRNNAKARVGNQLAQNFFEFALTKWDVGDELMVGISNDYWDKFCEMMFQTIFGESLEDYERSQRERWIAEAAYYFWKNSGEREGNDLSNWLNAEKQFEELSLETGMPPYQELRLRPHMAIQRRFT